VFDIPTSINETNSIKDFIPDGKLLYSIINYNHVCELHYNSDMTDEQIANYLSDNVNYSINIDIIKKKYYWLRYKNYAINMEIYN